MRTLVMSRTKNKRMMETEANGDEKTVVYSKVEFARRLHEKTYKHIIIDFNTLEDVGLFEYARRYHPGIPITLWVSEEMEAAIRALRCGDLDFVRKPAGEVRDSSHVNQVT